jgi:hypothetical protein
MDITWSSHCILGLLALFCCLLNPRFEFTLGLKPVRVL